jgi:SAM-dependent methyltransferase
MTSAALDRVWGTTVPRGAQRCPLCGGQGALFHEQVADHNFKWPGSWSHYSCKACDVLWLGVDAAPQPPVNAHAYYTHTPPAAPWWRPILGGGGRAGVKGRAMAVARSALALVPTVRNFSTFSVLGLEPGRGRRLLDVGCGAGELLGKAARLGWQVTGVEPDAVACEVARGAGLDVITGTVECVPRPEAGYAMVTLSHVLEHVADPVQTLRACVRVLAEDGCIAVVTPNVHGDGHRRFGAFWRELDAPRHLQVFSARSLDAVFARAGLGRPRVLFSARTALQVWPRSRAAMAGAPLPPIGAHAEPRSWSDLAQAEVRRWWRVDSGDELLAVAGRAPAANG